MSRFFIIVGVILLIFIAAFGFLVFRRVRTGSSPSSAAGTAAGSGVQPIDAGPGANGFPLSPSPLTQPVQEQSPVEVSREVFVRNFVERYGSYSTDAPYENYRRTEDMMSARLWAEAEKAMTKKVTGAFVQVITRVQSIRVQSESADRATMLVSTTREEERGANAPTLARKTAEVALVKVGDAWKADRVEWK